MKRYLMQMYVIFLLGNFEKKKIKKKNKKKKMKNSYKKNGINFRHRNIFINDNLGIKL